MDISKRLERMVEVAGSVGIAIVVLSILAVIFHVIKLILKGIWLLVELYWEQFEFKSSAARIAAIVALCFFFGILPILVWDAVDGNIHHIPYDSVLYTSWNSYTIKAEIANVRSAPSITAKIVGQLKKDYIADTLPSGSTENWQAINYQGSTSYISKSMLTLMIKTDRTIVPSTFPLRIPVWLMILLIGCGFLSFAVFHRSVDERLAKMLEEYVPIDLAMLKYRIPNQENDKLQISIG